MKQRFALLCGLGVFVLAAIAFRWLRADAGYWTIDDAGITYAAALELADHHSLAGSFEGTPVEGYSNPLVFFVVALLRVFGLFDPITTHVTLEMLVFAAMVTLVWSMLRSIAGELAAGVGALAFVTLQLATPATWVWYGSGLENVWVSTGLVALLWLCVRTARGVPLSHRWGTLAFAVAITRPEAPVYVMTAYGALLVLARPDGMPLRAHAGQVMRAAVVTLALCLVFVAWRRWAFGDWFPNTYYAKLHDRHVGANLRDYVIGGIFPYARAGGFALSVVPLLVMPKLARIGACVLAMLVASLALPIAAGADWMGEHRFATPFLAMAHVAYVMLLAMLVARLAAATRWRAVHAFALVLAVSLVAILLRYNRNALRRDITLNDVTIGRIAHLEGGLRWEQQMRLGVPFPVVQLPDAGGSMLVGGMQMVDNGFLTDFQGARIGRRWATDATDLRVLDQYQHEERRPDLISIDDQFVVDRSYFGTRYFMPPAGMAAFARDTPSTVLAVRRDLIETTLDSADLVHDSGTFQIYRSPEIVPFAAPGGLVRSELIVAWTAPPSGQLRASFEGDHDAIALRPYQQTPSGIERIALLVRAPDRVGTYAIELRLGDAVIGTLAIEVATDADRAVAAVLADPNLERRVRRLAWLREQRIPRLGMAAFHELLAALDRADRARSPEAGAHILKLRRNARLATREELPSSIRTAERTVIAQLMATCIEPTRIGCLGRTVDRLRRLGYLDVVERAGIATELARARAQLDARDPVTRYQHLLGLTLADPSDIALQRRLLRTRLEVANRFPMLGL